MGKKSRTPKNKTKPKKPPSVVSTAAADVSDNVPPPGAACWICLCEDPDDQGKPIVRDCSCRGNDAGFAHLSCLVDYAKMKSAEVERGEGENLNYYQTMRREQRVLLIPQDIPFFSTKVYLQLSRLGKHVPAATRHTSTS